MTKEQIIRALQWPAWFAVMAIVMGFLNRSRMKKSISDNPNLMHFPFGILMVGIGCTGFFIALAILSQIFPGADDRGMPLKTTGPLLGLGFLAFSGLGVPLIFQYFVERHLLEEQCLKYRTMTKRGVLRWSDISHVSHSPFLRWFRLETTDNKIIRISEMLIGLPEFARLLLRQVPINKIDTEAQTILEATAAGNLPPLWQ